MNLKICYFAFVVASLFFIKHIRCDISEVDILNVFNFITADNSFLIRPPGVNNSYSQPVIILVNSVLQQLDHVDDANKNIHVQMTVQLSWSDSRWTKIFSETVWPSNSSVKYAVVPNHTKIWIPNIIFPNAKSDSDNSVSPPSVLVRIFRNGTLSLNKRLSVTFECPMNFQRFPFDHQVCSIQLEIREYSSLSIDLIFSRNFHFYFMKFYLPVVLIVLISWLPFWLGRILILRIYIVFSSTIFLGWHYLAQSNDIRTWHITYLDVWRGINFVFVFGAAIQSIFVSHMIKTNTNKITRTHPDDSEKFKMLQCKNCPEKKRYLEDADEKTDLDLEVMKIKANFKVRFVNVHKEVEIIDTVSKLFFPSAYSIFVFFYWLRCT